ncbi:unnamed protein product [Lathyrus oleraceus]|uniref:Uncharacterized protein n=1 Tax=Pisum sativum TaxID=3888 RepID=A0A9D4Y0I4_PEA|nr:hypothetical protein KIW84_034864 [Pisum sativum]
MLQCRDHVHHSLSRALQEGTIEPDLSKEEVDSEEFNNPNKGNADNLRRKAAPNMKVHDFLERNSGTGPTKEDQDHLTFSFQGNRDQFDGKRDFNMEDNIV